MRVRGVVEEKNGLIHPVEPLELEAGTEVEIIVPEPEPKLKPNTAKELVRELRANGLIGLWKDRTDIGDSVEFARKLRERAQKRQRD